MSEQTIELSLVKFELIRKTLLHCVNWDDQCSCGIIGGGVGIERGEIKYSYIYIYTVTPKTESMQGT